MMNSTKMRGPDRRAYSSSSIRARACIIKGSSSLVYHSGLKSGSQAWMTGLRNRLIRTLNGFNIAEPIMRRSRPKSKNKLYAKIVMIIINHAK